jgi:hypothetical protein
VAVDIYMGCLPDEVSGVPSESQHGEASGRALISLPGREVKVAVLLCWQQATAVRGLMH